MMNIVERMQDLKLLPEGRGWSPCKPEVLRQVEELLFYQAECLDQKHWAGFIALFAERGVYWMPANAQQETHEGQPCIFVEDPDMMGVRAMRLRDATAWSMAPRWGTSHLLGVIMAFQNEATPQEIVALSRFHVTELRRDNSRSFAGRYRHSITRSNGSLRIDLQRVDLLSAEAPFDYVLQAWL
jgi:benzoate/toluate 1,2-dioxygenase beta subunit